MREGVSPVGNRLCRADRLEILERVCGGETQPQVARALGTTTRTVRRVLAAAGGAPSRRSRRRSRSSLRLSLSEREEIPELNAEIHGSMAFTLVFGVGAFTLLYGYLVLHRLRIAELEEGLEAREVELAIAERLRAEQVVPA